MSLGRHFRFVADKRRGDGELFAQHLRDFVERVVRRKILDAKIRVETIATDFPEDSLAKQAMAPVLSEENVFTFDAESALAYKSERKSVFFAPGTLDLLLGDFSANADVDLAKLGELQDALLASHRAVIFNAAQAIDLEMMGARDVRLTRFPAILGPSPNLDQGSVAIVTHSGCESALPDIEQIIKANYPTIKIHRHSATEPMAVKEFCKARIHIHIGLSGCDESGFRLIDSFSARCCVIQVLLSSQPKQADEDARVVHLKSGIVVDSIGLIPESIARILADPAAVVIFQRNGDQVVEAFNQGVEQQIWEAIV